jgi:hypothetical protein
VFLYERQILGIRAKAHSLRIGRRNLETDRYRERRTLIELVGKGAHSETLVELEIGVIGKGP